MTPVSADIKFQILHEHYKNSCSQLTTYNRRRDWWFLFVVIFVTIMLFQVSSPDASAEVLSDFVRIRLELQHPIDVAFLGSVVWVLLLGSIVRYFQAVVHLERQYRYVHNLEDLISPFYKNRTFTREGKSYSSNYPMFSKWTWLLYTSVFPVLLLLVVVVKVISEWKGANGLDVVVLVDTGLSVLVLVSIALGFRTVHLGK